MIYWLLQKRISFVVNQSKASDHNFTFYETIVACWIIAYHHEFLLNLKYVQKFWSNLSWNNSTLDDNQAHIKLGRRLVCAYNDQATIMLLDLQHFV